jgi:hypothetical protein
MNRTLRDQFADALAASRWSIKVSEPQPNDTPAGATCDVTLQLALPSYLLKRLRSLSESQNRPMPILLRRWAKDAFEFYLADAEIEGRVREGTYRPRRKSQVTRPQASAA